jgi:LmbE family N-acetylglucosaminyl deacetylase
MSIERTIKMRTSLKRRHRATDRGARRFAGSAVLAAMLAGGLLGQVRSAPPAQLPDERYKADILVIVAHPDDETIVSGYLAKAIFDEHRRVAAVFGTRGNGGGNAAGNEQAASLGAVREIEARRALAYFGVMNVWFLNGPDTPGQDVLRSLETWNHGASLGQVVRLVRLTRPQVILTWLPAYTAGENHDDHQAAGVLATEAFDLAGDATAFPEQLAAPRNREGISNLTEGLHPWQPQKIYYATDASHTEFMDGKGPQYSTEGESPAKKMPYYRLAAEEMKFHLTQGDTGQMAVQALKSGDFSYFKQPVKLVFGKSIVKAGVTDDVMAGVVPGPAPFTPVRGYRPQARHGLSIELGGPWSFYRDFQAAHDLGHLAQLVPPEVAVGTRERTWIPVLIYNDTDSPRDVTLKTTAPAGWEGGAKPVRYPVRAHETYPVYVVLTAPAQEQAGWQQVALQAESQGQTLGTITLRVSVGSGGLPQ